MVLASSYSNVHKEIQTSGVECIRCYESRREGTQQRIIITSCSPQLEERKAHSVLRIQVGVDFSWLCCLWPWAALDPPGYGDLFAAGWSFFFFPLRAFFLVGPCAWLEALGRLRSLGSEQLIPVVAERCENEGAESQLNIAKLKILHLTQNFVVQQDVNGSMGRHDLRFWSSEGRHRATVIFLSEVCYLGGGGSVADRR